MNPVKHIPEYLKDLKSRSSINTQLNAASQFKRIAHYMRGTDDPSLAGYIRWAEDNGVTPSCISSSGGFFRTFLKWCAKRGYVDQSASEGRIPTCKKTKMGAFTEEQYHTLLEVCKNKELKLMIMIAWHTGARISDIVGMKTESIKIEEGVFEFCPRKNRRSNKHVIIPIPEELEEPLRERMDNRWVFPDHWHNMEQPSGVMRMLALLVREQGWENLSFHSFRRSFVTRMLDSGIEPHLVSIMTGHSVDQVMNYQRVSYKNIRNILSCTKQRAKR